LRVIDITVKTEETQRLRIMYVLYCSTCIQNQTTSTIPSVNRSTNLAMGRHFQPGIKDMRTAVQKVPKVYLAVASSAWIDEGCGTDRWGLCPKKPQSHRQHMQL